MPQPRSTSAKRTTAAKPAASKTAAKTPAKRTTAAKRPTTTKRATPAKRPTATKRAAPTKRAPAAARPDEVLTAAVTAVRNSLTRGIVLSGERLQETVDDAVRRGRMTRDDAEDLAQSLLDIGRKQSLELLTELDALIGGRSVRDLAIREVDRARRATGLATFPISGYDKLSVAQVTSRLKSLTAAELRKVRDYERRHGKRKSVLSAIERLLSR